MSSAACGGDRPTPKWFYGCPCGIGDSAALNSFVRKKSIHSSSFVCREKKLIVEVDGGQQAENAKDKARDEVLTAAGYRVLRFWNSDVLKNKNGVLQVMASALTDSVS